MREFDYLTFDCYGTLIDWKSGIAQSISKAAGRLSMPPEKLMEAYVAVERKQEGDYKKYGEVLGNTFNALMAEMKLRVPKGASAQFVGSVPDWPAFPDTADSLRMLGKMGYRRYILSNIDNDLLSATIRRNGLEVDGTVTAEEVGSYKPSFGHWERFLRKTGAGVERVLHVAQSVYHDLVPAKKLGIESAWVNRYRDRLPSYVAPLFLADSLRDLTLLLE